MPRKFFVALARPRHIRASVLPTQKNMTPHTKKFFFRKKYARFFCSKKILQCHIGIQLVVLKTKNRCSRDNRFKGSTRFSWAAIDFNKKNMGKRFCFHVFVWHFERVKLLLLQLAKAQCQAADFSFPPVLTTHHRSILKTAAAILAAEQHLLSLPQISDTGVGQLLLAIAGAHCAGGRYIKAGEYSQWPQNLQN